MVDMDYLNIDMNICQLLLLRYNDHTSAAVQKRINFIDVRSDMFLQLCEGN